MEFMHFVFTYMLGESSVPLVEFMCFVFTHMLRESFVPLVRLYTFCIYSHAR